MPAKEPVEKINSKDPGALMKNKIKFSSYTYKEIQMGAVAKSYMRKGFLINEEMCKYLVIQYMRRSLVIYDFATAPFWISLYMRKIWFLFISAE